MSVILFLITHKADQNVCWRSISQNHPQFGPILEPCTYRKMKNKWHQSNTQLFDPAVGVKQCPEANRLSLQKNLTAIELSCLILHFDLTQSSRGQNAPIGDKMACNFWRMSHSVMQWGQFYSEIQSSVWGHFATGWGQFDLHQCGGNLPWGYFHSPQWGGHFVTGWGQFDLESHKSAEGISQWKGGSLSLVIALSCPKSRKTTMYSPDVGSDGCSWCSGKQQSGNTSWFCVGAKALNCWITASTTLWAKGLQPWSIDSLMKQQVISCLRNDHASKSTKSIMDAKKCGIPPTSWDSPRGIPVALLDLFSWCSFKSVWHCTWVWYSTLYQ